jgi:hypothetical protein
MSRLSTEPLNKRFFFVALGSISDIREIEYIEVKRANFSPLFYFGRKVEKLEPLEKLEERMVKIEERQANIETRVALTESSVKVLTENVGDIKDDTRWIIRLIIGSVVLAILGTVLVKTGVL